VIDREHVHYVNALGEKHFIGSIASELDLSHGIRIAWACVIEWNCTA
jgi:hypothetical protein